MVEKVMEAFIIDNDNKAEWALKKIKAAQEERDRLLLLAENAKKEIAEQEEKIKKEYENDTAYLKQLLAAYMQTVPTRGTKTQNIYKLFSGSLVIKHGGYEFKRDEPGLCEWLEKNGYKEFVKTEKNAAWGELKKRLTVSDDGNVLIGETGELVGGVKAGKKQDEFIIKF